MKKKLLIYSFLFLIAVLIFYVVMVFSFQNNIFSLSKINPQDYDIFKNEFRIDFPEGTIIENVGLAKGKDALLCAKFVIDKSMLRAFKNGIKFKTERLETASTFKLNSAFFPWWNITESEILSIEKNEETDSLIIYLKEKNGKIVIFISSGETLTGFSDRIYEIFNTN